MKKVFLFLSALLLSTSMWATYYIAGNGSKDNDWCCGKNWEADGCEMTDNEYSAKVPAGSYEFKVTDGTWENSWGVGNVDADKSTSGYEGTNNVKFTVASEANIDVTFDGKSIVLTSDVPFVVKYYAKNQWDGTEWTWKEMTQNKDVYTLDNVVFGGIGVNINKKAGDGDAIWIPMDKFKGDKIAAKDTVSLVFNPADSTLTATLIGHPCKDEYGILVNGNYQAASVNPERTDVTEYMVLGVVLVVDDSVQIFNNCAKEAWVIEEYMNDSYEFLVVNNKYVIEETASYDFYFQLGTPDMIFINQQQITTSLDNNAESLIQNSKFIENGKLYIRRGEHVFDAQGKMVK